MNIADLVTTKRPELRFVGIAYPTRLHVVEDAKRIYLELGIPVDINDNTISYAVPRVAAGWYAGAFERLTGRIAYNGWDDSRPQAA